MRLPSQNNRGGGVTEYIILLAAIIGILVLMLWNQIFRAINSRIYGIGDGIAVVSSDNPAAAMRAAADAREESESSSGSGGWASNWFNTPSERGTGGGGAGGGGIPNPEPSTGTFRR